MLGDHIRALKGGRWVHGIDLGDQRVLHLVEDARLAPGDRLRRVYKPDFAAGASRVELVVHRERTYPPRAVVARAYSRFMDPTVVAMFRDSEAFAAWCKIGRLPEAAPAAPKAAARKAEKPAEKPAARPAPAKPAPPKAVKAAAKPAPKQASKQGGKPAQKKAAKKPVAKAKAKPALKAKAKAKAKAKPAPKAKAKAKAKAKPAAKAAKKRAKR